MGTAWLAGVALAAVAALVPGASVRAQAPAGALAISGSSTVRDWTCREETIAATPSALSRPDSGAAQPGSMAGLTLSFPVHAIDCGDSGMNHHLRKALKASRYPTITFGLSAAEMARALAAGPQPVRVNGELTIAGETRPVQTQVTVTRASGQDLQVRGEQSLRMTDFGVKPPVLLMGMLRVRDLVHVAFDVVLRAAAVGRSGRVQGWRGAAPGLRSAARP